MVLSFSYGASHSLLGPMAPRISRRSMRAMELKKKASQDTPRPVEKKEKWPPLIFQRVTEDKEYHALEDYFWFYEEWSLINKRFAEKFGKRLQDVLMELIHMHRVKVENQVVMDNVKTLEDFFPSRHTWEESLRGGPPDTIGSVAAGEFPPINPNPGRRLVTRIGYVDKPQHTLTLFKNSDAHLKKRKEEWGKWENFCASMADGLRQEEPHYPEFPYLKVFGERLRKRAPKDCSIACTEEQKVCQPSPNIIPEVEQRPVYFDSPWAHLSPRWLHFTCKPGEIMGHMVKLENVGNTALFYRWERRPLESTDLTTPRGTLANCRNFSVMNASGSVLPGEAKEFIFRFSSDVEGFFVESWVLHVAPKLSQPFKPLYLRGVATLQELNRKLYNKLSQALDHRELMRGIGENLESIQERALELSRPTEEFRNAEYMFSSEAFKFIRTNLSMEPPVYFIPSVYTKLDVLARAVGNELKRQPPADEPTEEGGQELYEARKGKNLKSNSRALVPSRDKIDATKRPDSSDESSSASDKTLAALLGPGSVITTMAKAQTSDSAPSSTSIGDPEGAQTPAEDVWNGSVMAISDGIGMIQVEWIREQAQEQFDELLSLAQIPPHQTALLHFAMYHTLYDLAGAVEEIFERVTEVSIRPTAEQLVQNFYANYLGEAQDLLEPERSKKSHKGMQEKLDLVKLRKTELKGQVNHVDSNQVSRAENEEMLTYCFTWIQIMSELRCTMPEGFTHYQEDVEREEAAVMDRVVQKINDTHADDETKCWSIFSLERHKLEVIKEQNSRLPKMSS